MTLRGLPDRQGKELIDGILEIVDRPKPLHLSIVGGDPLVRFRELELMIPFLLDRGIHVQLVTSAFRALSPNWATLRNLNIVVSIDGLQPEHDVRRAPATYDRILKNIAGQKITIHCTITGQMMKQAVPTLFTAQHTAIPRTDDDTKDPNFLQAIANTAGFHFPTIEQGGTTLYPAMAQRATSVEVLRILISIGPTETMHFQTWSDKAGNAPPLTAVDPVTGVSVTFPDLNSAPFGGEEFQTNLIMPEPCPFLNRKLPPCSIIRPTETKGIAKGAVRFLTDMGLFIGQSPAFFTFLNDLAEDADEARRGR
jgi:hypothetical protein